MGYSVFFREGKDVFAATQYISKQLEEHKATLQSMTDELAATGHLQNSRATKETNGDWWLMLQATNGDLHTYSFFISRFEQPVTDTLTERSPQPKELVIIDPAGPRDSTGGYHPGYWTITEYAALMEVPARQIFLAAIHQVIHHIPSPAYAFHTDGSIAINIHEQTKAYTVVIECRAEWR